MGMPLAAPNVTYSKMCQYSFTKFHKTWTSSKAVELPLGYQTQAQAH
jgi:hypothetical protein